MGDIILFISRHSKLCEEPIRLSIELGIKIVALDSKDLRRYFPKVRSVPALRFSEQIGNIVVQHYIFTVSQVIAWLSTIVPEEPIDETKFSRYDELKISRYDEPKFSTFPLKDEPILKATSSADGGAPEVKSGTP